MTNEAIRSRIRATNFNRRLVGLLGYAKRRARKMGREFTLDKDWLLGLFEKQNGCCLLTGLPFVFQINKDARTRLMPFSPSLDRIDSRVGYTKENTRLVCTMINIGMNHFGEDNFAKIAQAYLEHTKSKIVTPLARGLILLCGLAGDSKPSWVFAYR